MLIQYQYQLPSILITACLLTFKSNFLMLGIRFCCCDHAQSVEPCALNIPLRGSLLEAQVKLSLCRIDAILAELLRKHSYLLPDSVALVSSLYRLMDLQGLSL